MATVARRPLYTVRALVKSQARHRLVRSGNLRVLVEAEM
jgi:hypothetical protein